MEQRDRGIDAINDQFAQGTFQTGQGFGTVATMHDQFPDQAVVIGRDRIAVIKCGIHPNAQTTRCVILRDLTGAGAKVRKLFSVDPNLNRVAVDLEVVLGERQALLCSNADLFTHEVDAKDAFGHGVFHLKAGVHFDEIELSVLIEELNRASARIAHFADCLSTDATDTGAFFCGDARARGLFKDLLVTTLERTITLTKVNAAAHTVAKDLHLNVARLLEVFFHVDFGVAKCGFRFRTCG